MSALAGGSQPISSPSKIYWVLCIDKEGAGTEFDTMILIGAVLAFFAEALVALMGDRELELVFLASAKRVLDFIAPSLLIFCC